jgi:hypothetical protein
MIKTHVKTTYEDEERGFLYHFEPIEATLSVEEIEGGYRARYLAQDECFEPDPMDDGLFLVHYHRDFYLRKDEIVTEDDIREWYRGRKIPQEKKYWIFQVSAYIHSGVVLKLGDRDFPEAGGYSNWDTSHVGAVLVSKKEWKTRKRAEKAALGLIDEVNAVNSGDVYLTVIEIYDEDKESHDYDAVGGFIGLDYAKQALAEMNGCLGGDYHP